MSSTSPHELAIELHDQFPHTPTKGQERLITAFSRFLFSDKKSCTLIVKGYAGTGKTTSIGAIVRTLKSIKKSYVMLAPTGRAAKVMSAYSGIAASTIHRRIYVGSSPADGDTGFKLGVNRLKNTVFIVDEASMIGQNSGLLDDLLNYVFSSKGCRLILVGDNAQLPPVGCSDSPALDEAGLKHSHTLTIATVELTEVVRQELNSSILINAHTLRLHIDNAVDNTTVPAPKIDLKAGPDLVALPGSELQEIIETLQGKYGEDGMVIITRSNKRAVLFNQEIRKRILDREDDINVGDRLMVVKNNYYWLREYEEITDELIANGDTLEVVRIGSRFKRYGYEFAEVDVVLTDLIDSPHITLTIMLSILNDPKTSLSFSDHKSLYRSIAEDYEGSKSQIHRSVIADECYQALQVKYAYSLTCHKAQGGQWPAVILDQGYLTDEMLNREWLRWLYTGFTRAEKELYLLNFDKKFY
jgi:ATP-dependent exoDNAse (exonuclease V) alpha subunit